MIDMRQARKLRRAEKRAEKERQETPCWRCGELLGKPQFGSAILEIEFADGSYSGRFAVPLCDSCLMNPHNSNAILRVE
ncbi:hypothetical protein LCGC14_1281430 [marine sediment metagenome]|uniref:Uncharacterized protein n=1 Tax=marine sediment metagenome TaxID=412755 RepID=A0A0F9NY46_9ZZZZ